MLVLLELLNSICLIFFAFIFIIFYELPLNSRQNGFVFNKLGAAKQRVHARVPHQCDLRERVDFYYAQRPTCILALSTSLCGAHTLME